MVLRRLPLVSLVHELLARLADGEFASEETVLLGDQLQEALRSGLDTYSNRTSRRHYRLYGQLPREVGLDLMRLEGATVVDVGCGSLNPFGPLFLYLMLGARRGIAVDLDAIQDPGRARRALADLAAMMLIDPHDFVGDYPIERDAILRHLASFDLARLRVGDPAGIDASRLVHLQEGVGGLSLAAGEADIVISTSFLEHVSDVDTVIADLARITKVGGVGVHRIDGADHERYHRPDLHALGFLEDGGASGLVRGCNRIRPLDFVPLFERHGFEAMAVSPFETIPVDAAMRERFVEPFRSRPLEVLGVIGVQLVVRRR